MLKAVIFDMDGTLGDTLTLCVESYRRCVREVTGKEPEAEEVERFFGVSDRGVLGQLLGMSPEDPKLPIEEFAKIYDEMHEQYAPEPFPGVRELLRRLAARGLRLAVITGKEPYTALPTLRRYALTPMFEICLYGDPYCNVKARRMLEYTQQTGLKADEMIYVGDMPSDVEQGRLAGVRVAHAAWAPGSQKYVADCRAMAPDISANSPEELYTALMAC